MKHVMSYVCPINDPDTLDLDYNTLSCYMSPANNSLELMGNIFTCMLVVSTARFSLQTC